MAKLDPVTRLVRTRLLGESLREIGVLVLIFSPLDLLLESKGALDWPTFCWHHHCVSWRYIALVFFTVAEIFALYYGIRIETDAELALREIEKGDQHDIPDSSD